VGRRLALVVIGIVAVLAVACFVTIWHPVLEPIAPPPPSSFDKKLVARGEVLARVGDCLTCHTAPGGEAFAGGRALATPFGAIYGTNITPDPETGIGAWSEAAFRRAMRDGIDRGGRDLYPVFPYEHFAKLTDDDIAALYAYMMTREPVRRATPANQLPFPYDVRPLLAGWKLLFLDRRPVARDAGRSDEWNRGAYLTEALAHCGACHTPRNRFGAEEAADHHFAGGEAEGWWAPPLDASSPAPMPWSERTMAAYLRSWEPLHGGAAGPMAEVVANLAHGVPDADVQAIATYAASFMPPESPDRKERAEAIVARGDPPGAQQQQQANGDHAAGGAVYAGACSVCHESGGAVPYTVRSLAQHTVIVAPDPRNLLHVVLDGVHPPEGAAGPIMPSFRDMLTEPQVVDLVAYLRARFSDAPPWTDTPAIVHRLYSARSAS
jgi:mono/diheme cytochrome c family protein